MEKEKLLMEMHRHHVFCDVIEFQSFYSYDTRGTFVKTYNYDKFNAMDLEFIPAETYYSVSKKNVIRGMHFQTPPYDHDKLIHVIKGEVIDVLLDLRVNSPTYKMVSDINLKASDHMAVYIPKGFAHGFKCMTDNTIMLYQCSNGYQPEADKGIRYDSIPYDWNITEPIISERDLSFPKLDDFDSPFT